MLGVWPGILTEPVIFIVMRFLLYVKSDTEEMFSLMKPFRLCTDVRQEWGVAPIHHQSGLV